jgi:tripartite ATP-independent transporter DctM subunit
MSNFFIAFLGFSALIALIAIRTPIAFSLALVGFAGLCWIGGTSLAMTFLGGDLFSSVASFSLTAVPLFLLMGHFAFYAGLTRDAFDSARIWFSRLPGGLAIATVLACAIFGAASGSGVAAAAALGRITVPEMLRYNYDKGLATGTIAAAATLDVLIPPSVIMVIYAVFVEQSVGRLLIAGILPGILSAAAFMLMLYIRVKLKPELAPPVEFRPTWRDHFAAFYNVWGIALLFGMVMGGIYSGFVTATEAGALGAFGAFVLMICVGELRWSTFRETIEVTARTTAMIFLIFIAATIFTRFIAITGAPQALAQSVIGLGLGPTSFVVLISVLYIFLGMFLDSISMMLLTLPVLLPILTKLNVDLIWFGIVVVKLIQIGAITPPFGVTVYVIKGVVGDQVPLETIFKGIGWFLVVELITLSILIAFPEISLWLPNQMMGKN